MKHDTAFMIVSVAFFVSLFGSLSLIRYVEEASDTAIAGACAKACTGLGFTFKDDTCTCTKEENSNDE